jgi:hypothetical protein
MSVGIHSMNILMYNSINFSSNLKLELNILRKNPTNALIYVNTILLKLLHFCLFQPTRGHLQGKTGTFREQGQ